MPDAWVVVLAVASFGGALAAIDGHIRPVPLVMAVLAVAAAAALRRPYLVCAAVALLAAALAQRSLSGLAPPATGRVSGEVTLVSDPVDDGRGGVEVDVRWRGRRLRALARGAAAATLDDRLTGERVVVLGDVDGPGPVERRLRHRHLAGRLRVDTVVGWRPGHGITRVANGLRRTLARGAQVLPERQQSLLAGLTLGDDRQQPADLTDAFRAAGLTHLLAVSGQNVAFALLVVSPALVRLRFGPRLVLTVAVLAGFALLTRFEPSVLRATAMALVASVAALTGRPVTTLRALGLGITGLLLVDPLLAASLGFRLSAAGAAGIILGAARIERALPGPRWLATPLSVTLTAQLAVSPLLVATFGSVPLASLPANLLAVPVAGPVMVWGLTAGLVAGVVGGPAAALLHIPTRVALAWVEGVALAATRWPLGQLGPGQLALATAGLAAMVAGRALRVVGPAGDVASPSPTLPGEASGAQPRPGPSVSVPAGQAAVDDHAPVGDGRLVVLDGGASMSDGRAPVRDPPRRAWVRARPPVATALRWLGAGLVAAGCGAGLVPSRGSPIPPGQPQVDVALGATAWRGAGGAIVVLDGRADATAVLRGLRDTGVARVDVVVLRTGAGAAADVADTLRRRWPALLVLAPPGSPASAGGDAVAPPAGFLLDIAGLRLSVVALANQRLDVRISRP